jgi:hypothetical protein
VKHCQNNSENKKLCELCIQENTMAKIPLVYKALAAHPTREFITIIPAITLSNQPENESFLL